MAFLFFDIVLLIMSIVARLLGAQSRQSSHACSLHKGSGAFIPAPTCAAFVCLFFSIISTSAYKLGNFGLLSRDFRHVCIIQARTHDLCEMARSRAPCSLCMFAQMVAFILCILVRALRTLGNILAKGDDYSRGVQAARRDAQT